MDCFHCFLNIQTSKHANQQRTYMLLKVYFYLFVVPLIRKKDQIEVIIQWLTELGCRPYDPKVMCSIPTQHLEKWLTFN